jgi:peptidoglycan/LPS O-acetylase OafA/YrhL
VVAGWQGGFGYALRLTSTYGFSFVAIFFGAVLVLSLGAAPRTWTARALGSRLLRKFGRYSYAIYIVHTLVVGASWHVMAQWVDPRFLPSTPLGIQLVLYGASFGGCVLLAAASWNLYEKPFLRLKRHFPGPHAVGL